MKLARAFTLMELLVAMGITSVIVVVMLRFFMDGSALWQRQEEKLDTFREARAALQIMAADFTNLRPAASLPIDFPLFALDWHKDTDPNDKVNEEIYGITAVRNQGLSDLCAIGYFCAWNSEKQAFVLKRQFTESDTTFEHLRTALPMVNPMNGKGAFNLLYQRGLPDNVQSVSDLASYIWDLKVEIPDMGNPPVAKNWPQGSFARELPPWIEVRFKALGANAARKIAGSKVERDTWFEKNSSLHRTLILPSEQQFVTRIKLCR